MANVNKKLMMKEDSLIAKDFSPLFNNLEGLSENQLSQHDKLYKGYIAKYNEVNKKLQNTDLLAANQNYSEFRSLKVELTHNLNGVILHEMYFANLIAAGKDPCQELQDILSKDFGSWDGYIKDLKATGMASRAGWAVTAYNYRDGKFYNYIIDQHNMQIPAFARPVLVMDTWEHAFMIDFGTDKKSYINTFLDNTNWQVMYERITSTLQTEEILNKF